MVSNMINFDRTNMDIELRREQNAIVARFGTRLGDKGG